MASAMGRALIIANLHKDDAAGVAKAAEDFLDSRNWDSQVLAFTGDPGHVPSLAGFDVAIILGGDGTVLYAARKAAPLGIPLLPVNLGRIGFIAGNSIATWQRTFDAWTAGRAALSRRLMLEIEVRRGGMEAARFVALNDGVVSAQGIAKVIHLSLCVNESGLGNYRSDGIIVATPTGSTAYSLAAGGPALHPEIPALVVTPICPFTLASRPLVLPDYETVKIRVLETRRSDSMLTVDGQDTFKLETGDLLLFSRAKHDAIIIVDPQHVFYEPLKTKLNWSGDSDA